MIRFPCPHCGLRLTSPDGTEGKRLRCRCKQAVTVPQAAAEVLPEFPPPQAPQSQFAFDDIPGDDEPIEDLSDDMILPPVPMQPRDMYRALQACPDCGHLVSSAAESCTRCGCPFDDGMRRAAKRKSQSTGRAAFWLLSVAIVFAFVVCGGMFLATIGSNRRIAPAVAFSDVDTPEKFIAVFGRPDSTDSTEFDNPRPPIVTKFLRYNRPGVNVMCIPDVKFGTPPPYPRWIVAKFISQQERVWLTPEEAMQIFQTHAR